MPPESPHEPSSAASSASPPKPPPALHENPQLLLAELEAARLALRARPKPSRGRSVLLGFLILLLLGGLALWCLSMMGNLMTKPKSKGDASAKNSFASGHAYL